MRILRVAAKTLVELCFEAGAKDVTVMDNTTNQAQRCYARSGIAAAAKEAGGNRIRVCTARRFSLMKNPVSTLRCISSMTRRITELLSMYHVRLRRNMTGPKSSSGAETLLFNETALRLPVRGS